MNSHLENMSERALVNCVGKTGFANQHLGGKFQISLKVYFVLHKKRLFKIFVFLNILILLYGSRALAWIDYALLGWSSTSIDRPIILISQIYGSLIAPVRLSLIPPVDRSLVGVSATQFLDIIWLSINNVLTLVIYNLAIFEPKRLSIFWPFCDSLDKFVFLKSSLKLR